MRAYLLGLLLVIVGSSDAAGQSEWVFLCPELEVSYSPGAPSVTFDVEFSIWQQSGLLGETQGFSMGVAQDPAIVRPVDVSYNPAVMGGPFGNGPNYFQGIAYDDGWTCGVVYSVYGQWTVAFPEPDAAIIVTYSSAPGAAFLGGSAGATCPLNWTGSLGQPPVASIVVVGGSSIAPVMVDGAVTLVASQFIRGDMNGDGTLDISDVFAAESYLFVSGPVPGCLAALDSNSDGGVDIADIIHLLSYLFVQGEAPGAPFPDCGPNPGALACESYTCP